MQASAESTPTKARARAGDVERAYKFADLSAYPFKKRLTIRLADLASFQRHHWPLVT